jgi:DNA-directed RNA polymerase beta subunit
MALPSHLRAFDDTRTAREWLHTGAVEALQKRFPIEDQDYKLELQDVRIDGPTRFGLARQKQALLKDEQLRVPIKGRWRLSHKPTGQVLDEREDTVLHLPYLTDRGTMIYRGNEYSSVSQSRLKAGVYSRRKKSGEIESFFNIKPGTGRSFRLWLEPQTGVFKVKVGQSNIPLYPMLSALGVKDKDLLKTWGPDILIANQKARAAQAIDKLYTRFTGKAPTAEITEQARRTALAEALAKAEVDPTVISRTLGVEGDGRITPDILTRSTQKLLHISRGEDKPDDRDAPMFSRVLSVEDFIKERIENDAGRAARTLLWKARRDRSLKRVGVGALNSYSNGYLLGSRLTMPLEETNPLSLLEQLNRVTKLGAGGISDAESITDEARNVNIGQLGFIDPVTGPEDIKIGIDTRLAYKTFKGRDQQMYGEFKDARSGELSYLRPEDLDGKVVAFPGQMAEKGTTATASIDGEIRDVPKNKVDLEVPSMAHMLSSHVNLNPMPTSVQPARQFYGAKFWSQYLPQVNGEAPLVDTAMPDSDSTFTQHFGKRVGTLTAERPSTVVRVTKDKVVMRDVDGEKVEVDLVQDFPFNRISGVSYRSAVKAGDAIEAGDVVARSNFVDDDNALTLGRNLSVAVIPFRGNSYEDGIVISEDAAKKLTTGRLYGFDAEAKHGVSLGKNKYASLFPDRFSQKQLEKLDENGIVKPGTVLQRGDPIILSVGPKLLTAEDIQLGRLHKALRQAHTDKATTWDHDYEGVVTDAVRTRSGAKVNAKADVPVQPGDKLSPRWGLKGVVAKIIPMDKMPRHAGTNEPYDLLLNPMTILSRVAAGALVEMQLGKLAKLRGKGFKLPQQPPEEGWSAWALRQLEEAGVDEKDQIFDPDLGRALNKPVATGNMYWMAFHHLSEKKLSDRGSSGLGYTQDEQPARGGAANQQAKKMSQMDSMQLLAHGATAVVRDSQVIRGAKNEEYWKALKLGRPLPKPDVPFVYNKFLNLLNASGINIEQKGDTLKLLPMMDSDIEQLSHGAIKTSAMVDDKMEPIKGGLFDPGKTGGAMGKFWSHIDLAEPMPNPVFEEPIRRLLGLRKQDFTEILAGRKDLGGKTGGQALSAALEALDIDAQLAQHTRNIKKYRGANRDNSVKILGYLDAAKKQGIHPSKWMLHKLPVLPPVFRPVSRLGDITIEADLNELYRDTIEVNNAISTLRRDLPESALQDEKDALYRSIKAVTGLGDPITPEGKSRRLKGALRNVFGDSPKSGLFQNRVLSKPVDLVGRAVVTPDPSLDMDTVGLPEDAAWDLYKDFVVRRLVRQNIPSHRALQMIEDREAPAKSALRNEMQSRPVIVDRAPTWHKFNLMAFRPHLVEGKTMHVSPLITKGFNMDFDGDAVNFHVPASDDAVSQAYERMMPSKNLFSLTDLKSPRHTPQQEMALGLYLLTRKQTSKDVKTYATVAQARRAYKAGEIDANDPIDILELEDAR